MVDETDIAETVPPSANVSFIGPEYLESTENDINDTNDSRAVLIHPNNSADSDEPPPHRAN